MSNYLSFVIDTFIPERLKDSPYQLRMARALVSVMLYSLLIAVVTWSMSILFFPENAPSALPGIALAVLIVLVFRVNGNFVLAGNLLALAWAVTLFPTIYSSGGLYSDNLLWLVIAPLIAFLYANYQSGVFWSIVLLGVLSFSFYKSAAIGFENSEFVYQHDYYFSSYFLLFTAVLGIAFIFRRGKEDVIQEMKAHKELLNQQKNELAKQAEELQAAKTMLLRSNKELENFAYVASHDLKEPLRMISAYSTLLEKQLKRSAFTDDRSKEYLSYVTDGSKRMENLLEDLLEFSRLGRNQHKLKDIDLNDILVIVMGNLMVKMQETQTVVTATQLPAIKGVPSEMIQLFQNLISNAIKFQHPGEKPSITIMATEEKEGYCCFSFCDNGIGIPKERQNAVFTIFERVHGKEDYEGAGIGLATCKKIVEHLGGKIWLSSIEGEGTTFYFTLPVSHTEVMVDVV